MSTKITDTELDATPAPGDNSARLADTAFVTAAVAAAVGSGVARAWVSFSGLGVVVIHDSYNVASVLRLGLGQYRINFITPMPSANYAVAISGGSYNSPSPGTFTDSKLYDASGGGADPTTANLTVAGIYGSGSSLLLNDLERCDVAVFSN